jgi:hypothetical protein
VDECTKLSPAGNFGFRADSRETKQYTELFFRHFDNTYVDLKHWLMQIKALEHFFKDRNQPFVFLKGFDNYLKDLHNITYSISGFNNLTEGLKSMLDFDQRPDEFIAEKINNIQLLKKSIDSTNWVNLNTASMLDMQLSYYDFSDDRAHPGIKSNQEIFDKFIKYNQTYQLI